VTVGKLVGKGRETEAMAWMGSTSILMVMFFLLCGCDVKMEPRWDEEGDEVVEEEGGRREGDEIANLLAGSLAANWGARAWDWLEEAGSCHDNAPDQALPVSCTANLCPSHADSLPLTAFLIAHGPLAELTPLSTRRRCIKYMYMSHLPCTSHLELSHMRLASTCYVLMYRGTYTPLQIESLSGRTVTCHVPRTARTPVHERFGVGPCAGGAIIPRAGRSVSNGPVSAQISSCSSHDDAVPLLLSRRRAAISHIPPSSVAHHHHPTCKAAIA